VITDRQRVDDRADARDRQVTAGGATVRNVSPAERAASKFTRSEAVRSGAGLRVPTGKDTDVRRGESARPGGKSPTRITPSTRGGESRTGESRPSVRGNEGRTGDSRPSVRSGDEVRIRPVEPRDGTTPTWSGRRSAPSRPSEPAKPAERTRDSAPSRVEKVTPRGESGSAVTPPPSRRDAGNSSGDAGRSSGGGRAGSGGSSGGSSSGSSSGGERGGSGGGGRTRGGR
jgi:hypothetical protein